MIRRSRRITPGATPVATLAQPRAGNQRGPPDRAGGAFARAPAGRRFAILSPLRKHGSFMTSTPPGDEPRDRPPTDASLYALEKLAQAVDELATGTGNLRDRLCEAAHHVLRIQPDEIPDELRHVLMEVKADLAQPKWDEDRLVETLKITDDEGAKAIAHRILELYRELWIRLMR